MANNQLVLITGASGHLDFRTLVFALQYGYHVRAAVRSTSKAAQIRAAESVRPFLDQLEFIEVPDILAEGAYDEAVKGVDYVLHVASPIPFPTENYERDLIEPAVKGTVGILKSVAKEVSVKRVVITSSEVAIIPWKDFAEVESDTVFTAYAASKVLALHSSQNFMASLPNPHFSIINIIPSFILGANELTTSTAEMRTQGTNHHVLTPLLGIKNPSPLPSTTVFVDDVARIEVLSLDVAKIQGGQNFLISSGGVEGTTWNDAVEIVKKGFSEEEIKLLGLEGSQPTKRTMVDSKRTEEVFGFKLADYEVQVKSVVGYYLQLLRQES